MRLYYGAPVMYGEHGRFRGPEKTCDNITFHSENCHVRYCRYHFSYNFEKKGNPVEFPYGNLRVKDVDMNDILVP